VGAGLFIRSALRLQQVPLGFESARSVTARVALPPDRYRDDAAVADAYRRMLEQVRGVPGIDRAGAATGIPLVSGGPDASVQIEGKPYTPGTAISPSIRMVTDQYIEAIGMALRRGRTFQPADMALRSAPVVLVNERLAALAWPGEDPVGKRLSTWTADPNVPEWRQVIGIVGDVRSFGPENPARPELFLPYTQPPPEAWLSFQRSMALVASTGGDPAAHAASLRQAVRSVDASLALYDVLTMGDAVESVGASARFSTSVVSLLAAAGALLAALGIYGVIAFFVTQRTPEIGLRLALGASPRSVLMMVLAHGTLLTAAGVAIGLAAAFGVTRLVTTMLFEITPTDAPSYAAGTAGLFVVALLACVIPALRAIRVDPVKSLTET
jgi:predicted permease